MFKNKDPWGDSQLKQSSGVFTVVVINSLFAVFYLFISVMHSFLQMPMFGDEMESSPRSIIISTFIWMLLFDGFALWRAVKLVKHWALSEWNKAFLWVYQIVFLLIVGYSNFWMMNLVWFWWGK